MVSDPFHEREIFLWLARINGFRNTYISFYRPFFYMDDFHESRLAAEGLDVNVFGLDP